MTDTVAKIEFSNLAEFLQAANDMVRFSGIDPLLIHIEDFLGAFSAAVLVEETLTDESKVYTLSLK